MLYMPCRVRSFESCCICISGSSAHRQSDCRFLHYTCTRRYGKKRLSCCRTTVVVLVLHVKYSR